MFIEIMLHNVEMRQSLNCHCQNDNREERLIYNDCVHCLTLTYDTMFKEEYENMCRMITKKHNSKRKMSLVQCRHYKSKETQKGSRKEMGKKNDKRK